MWRDIAAVQQAQRLRHFLVLGHGEGNANTGVHGRKGRAEDGQADGNGRDDHQAEADAGQTVADQLDEVTHRRAGGGRGVETGDGRPVGRGRGELVRNSEVRGEVFDEI